MATADLLFDTSTFCYPEYLGGLYQLVEEVTITSFVPSFESANNNIKLTWDQLRECWFHALHQEHGKILSNTANITQDQIQHADELLYRGIAQVNTLQWLPTAKWEAADYDPDRKMNDEDYGQISKQQKVSRLKKAQDYDPVLLLQAIPEISLHAKRFYEEGVKKFLRKTKGRCNPARVEEYKLQCVCLAQDHVKGLLRASYSAEKKARAGEFAQYEETAGGPQQAWYKWKRDAKWKPVWNQMRAERKRIASELGNDPLIEQGLIIDTHPEIRTNPSHVSGFIDVTTCEGKRLLRTMKAQSQYQSASAVEVSGVQTRSKLRQLQTECHKGSVAEMEDDFKNLRCEDYPESSQPAQLPTKDQIFARMRQTRRERKNLLRLKELEKRITAGWDKDTNPVSVLSNGGPFATSTDDPGRALTTRQQRNLEKKARHYGGRKQKRIPFNSAGTSLDTSHGSREEAEDQGVPVLPSFTSHEGESEGAIINVEAQDEPQFCERDEMDVEISRRIAKLKM